MAQIKSINLELGIRPTAGKRSVNLHLGITKTEKFEFCSAKFPSVSEKFQIIFRE